MSEDIHSCTWFEDGEPTISRSMKTIKKGDKVKKILLSVLLLLGLNVSVYAEEVKSKQNNYVYVDELGYAVPQDAYCKKYINIIKSKDAQIKALSEELASVRSEQQMQLQKHLKKTHDKEMQKFDKKRSDTAEKETNSIIISDKPTP